MPRKYIPNPLLLTSSTEIHLLFSEFYCDAPPPTPRGPLPVHSSQSKPVNESVSLCNSSVQNPIIPPVYLRVRFELRQCTQGNSLTVSFISHPHSLHSITLASVCSMNTPGCSHSSAIALAVPLSGPLFPKCPRTSLPLSGLIKCYLLCDSTTPTCGPCPLFCYIFVLAMSNILHSLLILPFYCLYPFLLL